MTRQSNAVSMPTRSRWSPLGLAVLAVGVAAARLHAAGLTYVDANDLPPANLTPASALNGAGGTPVNTDNLWHIRTAFGAGSTIWESGLSENSPTLTESITGLTPGTNYDLYAVFWTDKDENWTIQSGLSAGSMTLYSWSGEKGNPGVPTSIKGVTAGGAVWDFPPPPTPEGTSFTQRPADPLVMLLAKAGTAMPNASGQIDVFVDDYTVQGGGTRAWFDGVAYVNAGTQIALTASINRATGALTISNPTSQAFHVKSITLDSPGSALSATGWTPVAGRLDGAGNKSFDADAWTSTTPATTPYAIQLTEAEGVTGDGQGGTLAANGGSLGLGNVWVRTPIEDIRLSLVLNDDSLVMINPTFTGAAIAAGDFDANGAINKADFAILLTNLHTNISALTTPAAFMSGDFTGDKVVNFDDFAGFRAAYDAANGAGAFAQMLSQVPEPATATLAFASALALVAIRRRRLAIQLCGVALCLAVAGQASATVLLAVDVNDRTEGETASNPAINTVTGFQPFVMGGAGVQPNATNTISGYSVTFTAVDATGAPLGNIDDRDRTTPTTAPTFNQLYDDFFFAAADTGIGGGVNLSINGGGLTPNTNYKFSLFSFDTGSTAAPQPRTSDWLDGNNSDTKLFTSSFSGATMPTTDDQYKYTANVRTDATGALLIKGRATTTVATPAVFVNGFLLEDLTITIPVELTLEVNKTTGGLRVLNEQTVDFSMDYYEIRSASGALAPASWAGLDGLEGNDPVGTGWDKAGGSSANILSEVNLEGDRSFTPGASASLGAGFAPGGAEDLSFIYAAAGGQLRAGIVKYVTGGGTVLADFNGNGTVDAADLAKWRTDFHAGAGSDADGDGDSDGQDFLVWQRRLGATTASASVAAIPEPSALAMLALTCGALAGAARKRR